MRRIADVAIVGAGVIGAAVAYVLSRSTKLRIVVIERGTPGCEASNAAAGVLAVASGQARRGVLLELRRLSARMFPSVVEELEDETGIALGYRREGHISLAFSEPEALALGDLVHHRTAQGFHCQMLERTGVLSLEPSINPHVHAGALFADDCAIDNERLVAAFVDAAQQRGVEFHSHTAVESISAAHGTVRVEWRDDGLEAATAVIAAGAWSAELLKGCGIKVPIRPARGEMAAVRPSTWGLQHTLASGETYLVPRHGGDILVGSTTAFVGFDKHVTPEGLATLRTGAAHLVPLLQGATLVRTWAGLRPCSTIRRPIIAPLPGRENVLLAAGHHRNGILLAPITAQLVTEIITGATPSVPLRPFGYRKH